LRIASNAPEWSGFSVCLRLTYRSLTATTMDTPCNSRIVIRSTRNLSYSSPLPLKATWMRVSLPESPAVEVTKVLSAARQSMN
jgi:hypothetical protein